MGQGLSGSSKPIIASTRLQQGTIADSCRFNIRTMRDHRIVKKRVWLAKGHGSFQSAWRTLQGIETVHMIRKGRVRWLAKDDALGQALFITDLFGIPA